MNLDPKVVEAYIQDVLARFEDKPDTLEKNERRLLGKHKHAMAELGRLNSEIEQLASQINQAQNRLRETQDKAYDARGKATGIVEALVSLKFDIDPIPEEAVQTAEVSKGNGSSDPTKDIPGNRKARRTAKAKAKKEQRRQPTKQ